MSVLRNCSELVWPPSLSDTFELELTQSFLSQVMSGLTCVWFNAVKSTFQELQAFAFFSELCSILGLHLLWQFSFTGHHHALADSQGRCWR